VGQKKNWFAGRVEKGVGGPQPKRGGVSFLTVPHAKKMRRRYAVKTLRGEAKRLLVRRSLKSNEPGGIERNPCTKKRWKCHASKEGDDGWAE